MPRRHGLYRKDDGSPGWTLEKQPGCRVGIVQVLRAMTWGPFRKGYRTIYPTGYDPATAVQHHFEVAFSRLLHTLDVFQQQLDAVARKYGGMTEEGWNSELLVAVAGDGFLTYLNMTVDDVAKIIPFVMTTAVTNNTVEGFGELKANISQKGDYPPLKLIFGGRSRGGRRRLQPRAVGLGRGDDHRRQPRLDKQR